MVNGSKVAISAAALLALASLAKRGSRSLELTQKLTYSELSYRVEAQLDSSRWWVNHLKKLRIEVDEDDIEEDLRQDPGYEWVDNG